MIYNYKNNWMTIVLYILAFFGFMCFFIFFNFFSFKPFRIENAQWQQFPSLISSHFVGGLNEKRCKEGFVSGSEKSGNGSLSFVPWPKDLVQRFNIYQATVAENNYQYNMLILQQQATAAEAEDLLKTGHWSWSDDIKQLYMDAVSRSPIIKVDSGEALNSAMKIYNQNAVKQLLAFNTKEGDFLIYGTISNNNNDTIKCSNDLNSSVLLKTVFNGYNLKNGYKNTTTTTIKNEDIPSEVKGFSFVNGSCNPCVAINENPDYNCPFKINTNDGSSNNISPIWSDLWKLF